MVAAHILPIDITISVEPAETLMSAATRQGLYWPTVCHGDGDCGSCVMIVHEGEEHLSPVGPLEQATLARGPKARERRARLACQTRLTGPVRVSKRGVRRPETACDQRAQDGMGAMTG